MQKFARLAELKSFTRTAEVLHISQPALSMAIDKLERELKSALLVRSKRKIELTEAGQLVYLAAKEHRITNENLAISLVVLNRKRPTVAIGMIDSIAATFSTSDQPFDNLESHANVTIVVNNSRYLRDAVKNLTLDLAFVVQDSRSYPGLDVKTLGSEPFVLVCRPDRLASAQAELGKKTLAYFICYDQSSTSYGHINHRLQNLGITVQPTFYSTSPDVMLRMVLRGKRVAALPYLSIRELLKSGGLVPLSKDGQVITIERPISVVKVHAKLIPNILEEFIGQAEKTLKSVSEEAETSKLLR